MRWRRLVPGALAAHGDTLWVADVSRPCLLQIHDGVLARVHWWGRPEALGSSASRLHADKTGVWVVAEDTVVHCELDGACGVVRAEVVGATALGHGLLAVSLPHSWPSRSSPDLVRLLSRREGVAEVEVPGQVHALVPTNDGFLAHVVDHAATSTTPLFDRTARLASISTTGGLRLGPPMDPRTEWLQTLVGGSHPRVLVSDGRGWPPRLAGVLADLSPSDGGLRLAPLAMWGGEDSGGRAVVASHLPDGSGTMGWWPLSGPIEMPAEHSFLLTAFDLDTDTPLGSWLAPGYPQDGAWARPDRFWASVFCPDNGGCHAVFAWDPSRPDSATAIDLTALDQTATVGSGLRLPMTPPAAATALEDIIEHQRQSVAAMMSAYAYSLEIVDVVTQGDWPQTHAVVRFRARELGAAMGASAWPLFDGDGQPVSYDEEEYQDYGIDEEIDPGALRGAMLATPDGQVVWLRRPVVIDGLLP